MADLLKRVLQYNGYIVDYVMNLTDVGHLTGDNLGDTDTGEDRLEKAAKKERKTAWEIADYYGKDFVSSFSDLNLEKPKTFPKATQHIKEQIALVGSLEKGGYTYRIKDGIYFDVRAYEAFGNKYGELSDLDVIKEGSRVEPNPEKKDPRDFALWKFSPSGVKRDMEWESPWGLGFPGWHVECSAMSMKYLGEQFDIHAGGIDLKSTHHPNEIAQSEAATGKKPFAFYWVHGAFLTVDGGRMGKSLGNAYTLADIKSKGYDPLALRYLYLTGHYRKQINFTWEALESAANTLKKLYDFASGSEEPKIGCAEYEQRFLEAVNNDLDMPKALAVVWELIKSDYPVSARKASLFKFDEVLGLNLKEKSQQRSEIPGDVKSLVEEREAARSSKDFAKSDMIRKSIEAKGFTVEDTSDGTKVKAKS